MWSAFRRDAIPKLVNMEAGRSSEKVPDMPITYRYLPSCSAVLVTAYGVLTLSDMLDHLASLVQDPQVSPEHVTLFDTTGVTEMALTPADIVSISEFTRANAHRIVAKKLAIVTTGSREASLAQQYERLAASFEENTIVFYSRDVACKWLGIPDNS